MPAPRSPTTGADENSETSSLIASGSLENASKDVTFPIYGPTAGFRINPS